MTGISFNDLATVIADEEKGAVSKLLLSGSKSLSNCQTGQ